MRAIGFDLGDTLITYDEIAGGSFKAHFRKALGQVCAAVGMESAEELLIQGEWILSKYNTRENPRELEVTDTAVFTEVLEAWQADLLKVPVAIKAFFAYFQQTSRAFADTEEALRALKQKGISIGILTDVPYGMNRELVMSDVAPIQKYVDVVVTSAETGFRKPRPEGYRILAGQLQSEPQGMIYVGNEPKDISGASAAGMIPVLLDRDLAGFACGQRYTIRNLGELEGLLRSIDHC
ncbi:HAD family hydrolase [Paenibacillus tengchongensis]|uniref:HAD family hydrolase n=1 Tax=Paenibacillus tengchongensis TaxID=2608684 RepID=UPI0016523734|nr:HAD family hydrolase [Paenibacillus tengchongensis]